MNAPLPAEALPWSPEEFEARLRAKEARYHIHHPFNKRLNSGALQPFQVRGWVANRFYYQQAIPMKDAAVMANCDDRATRRRWIDRMLDHDGHGDHQGPNAGGIEIWTQLGIAVGLKREDLWSGRHVQPGVRFAVDAYVNFARRQPWQEGVISSLTEMFAPKIHADRLAGWDPSAVEHETTRHYAPSNVSNLRRALRQASSTRSEAPALGWRSVSRSRPATRATPESVDRGRG